MNKRQRNELYKIIVSAVLYICAIVTCVFIDSESGYGKVTKAVLFAIPYVILSVDVYIAAFKNLRGGQFLDENFLMLVATIGAVFTGEYSEAVAVMLFYQVGELFQNIAVNKSRQSVSELMDIVPEYANLVDGDEITQTDPDDVNIGDTIVIKAGERIPLDCKVIKGSSFIDTSSLTGESVPRKAEVGDELISGCINKDGLLYAEVTKNFDDSTVAKILELVENASDKKAPTEKFISKFAKYYTPLVVLGAVVLATVPSIIFGDVAKWIHRACIFLVVSCPCALVISVPMSFFGGIGAASKNGILIKGSNYIESVSKMNTIIFDKTGTLTKGEFKVSEIYAEKCSKEELLEFATLAESYSNHPIAVSVRNACPNVEKSRVSDVNETAGQGIKAIIDGKSFYVGNETLMKSVSADYKYSDALGTVIYISTDDEFLGYIVISDTIKENAQKSLKELKKYGIEKTVMLTGDKKEAGERTAELIGIDEVYTELLPADKVAMAERIISEGESGKVAFVGDGINDAPVLMRSDIGIAMGSMGSDAAIEAADIVLIDDNIAKIPLIMKISVKTMSIVKQNIVFALTIKFGVLILSAIGLANMWLAVFADVGVSVIAILNAMRALNVKAE